MTELSKHPLDDALRITTRYKVYDGNPDVPILIGAASRFGLKPPTSHYLRLEDIYQGFKNGHPAQSHDFSLLGEISDSKGLGWALFKCDESLRLHSFEKLFQGDFKPICTLGDDVRILNFLDNILLCQTDTSLVFIDTLSGIRLTAPKPEYAVLGFKRIQEGILFDCGYSTPFIPCEPRKLVTWTGRQMLLSGIPQTRLFFQKSDSGESFIFKTAKRIKVATKPICAYQDIQLLNLSFESPSAEYLSFGICLPRTSQKMFAYQLCEKIEKYGTNLESIKDKVQNHSGTDYHAYLGAFSFP